MTANANSPNSRTIPSPPHVVEGEHLSLRGLTPDDASEAHAAWMNDPEINCYTESRFTRHTLESIRQYIETITSANTNLFLAIIAKEEGHIGNIKLSNIDRHHGTAEVGIIIGDKRCWGRGYGCEAIDLLAEYAFTTLGLRKLTAGIYETNTGSIRAFEKAGFVVEGVMKEQYISDGKAIDAVRLGRLRPSSSATAGP
jgi:RimJ/RimL family protein N-acetyltransferase